MDFSLHKHMAFARGSATKPIVLMEYRRIYIYIDTDDTDVGVAIDGGRFDSTYYL